jgi:hypothetical protein
MFIVPSRPLQASRQLRYAPAELHVRDCEEKLYGLEQQYSCLRVLDSQLSPYRHDLHLIESSFNIIQGGHTAGELK